MVLTRVEGAELVDDVGAGASEGGRAVRGAALTRVIRRDRREGR